MSQPLALRIYISNFYQNTTGCIFLRAFCNSVRQELGYYFTVVIVSKLLSI